MEIKVLDHNQVLNMLPDRPCNSHKGSFGKLLLLCGSRGYTGAAALAAMGALRCGAGLVYLGVPESIYQIEAVKLTEPVVLPMPDLMGMFAPGIAQILPSVMESKDAILIGPGIGRSDGSFEAVRTVLEQFNGPVILDADGINVIEKHKDLLRGRTSPTVITPHDGEFRRIGGKLTADRVTSAAEVAGELGIIVLLKGHKTIITDGNICFENNTGNPGMATGGSGDVLAGMIAALIGQGIQPLEAAACGAWLHGAAGDLCAHKIGQYGMLPTDVLRVLPRLLK